MRRNTILLPIILLYLMDNMLDKSFTIYMGCHLFLSQVKLQKFRKFT